MTAGHSERAHAKLSASGSKRWMTCPGSVRLEENLEDTTSSFAEEGTAAHELSEVYLREWIGSLSGAALETAKAKAFSNQYYSQSMEDHVGRYVDLVIERINEARARSKDAVVLIEQRLDFSKWVPDGFGTGDVLIIADGIMEIIDLKYGQGVPVSAEDNPQPRLYGLGALNDYGFLYDIETVRMTIIQPRLDSISTDEMSAEALLKWAEDEVKPKAELALSDYGSFEAGDHCQFCKARSMCKTRAFANLELAKYDFQDPDLLTIEEVADILSRVDNLVKWAGDVKADALQKASKQGVRYPGWKLVEGRSNRMFTDKWAVVDTLYIEGYTEGQIYKPRELFGIGDLEDLLGKKNFKKVLEGLVIKPAGKPTLAPESDKRPEMSSASSAASDFAEDLPPEGE